MTEYSPIYKLALGAVWTAGYRPDEAERNKLRQACGTDIDFEELYHIGGTRQAVTALQACGYDIADNVELKRANYDLLKPLPRPTFHNPMAEHVARLVGKGWFTMAEGQYIGLQGNMIADRRGFEIANARGGWHLAGNRISMGAGGPASIAHLDCQRLKPTNETYRLLVWSWVGRPQANGGANFYLTVPVWEWTPTNDDDDFISDELAAEPFSARL